MIGQRKRPERLLNVAEMGAADRTTIDAGTAGFTLMKRAGKAVADVVTGRFPAGPVLVLAGPGNNGGDGFVVAEHLRQAGRAVRLMLLGEQDRLSGDAKRAADAWGGEVQMLDPNQIPGDAAVVVDALFGAGLVRALDGRAKDAVDAVNGSSVPVVAVDLPSGLHGDTGQVLGTAPKAHVSVTFCCRKPGHLLYPGKALSGDVVVADIGISDDTVARVGTDTFVNGPALWQAAWPQPTASSHKHNRGHLLIWGGGQMTGAARLAAQAARRMGAGLVTLACPEAAVPIYAAAEPGLLIAPVGAPEDWRALLDSRAWHAVLIGPGAGASPATRARVLAALEQGYPIVLDADALSVFQGAPQDLFHALSGPAVFTPHGGEFARLFGDAEGGGGTDKLYNTRSAAEASGAVIVQKGADTVIAAPGSWAAIQDGASPYLATGGTGDVLAGAIVGLLAQGMAPHLAAAAGVWAQGRAAAACGPGLLAEDLPAVLPRALREI